jgi:hypothetical protein
MSLQDFALGLGARLIGQAPEEAAFARPLSTANSRSAAAPKAANA